MQTVTDVDSRRDTVDASPLIVLATIGRLALMNGWDGERRTFLFRLRILSRLGSQ
jgi:hypothetical protein